ncbi:MAG: response regulator [Polyangiaceae bacterium]|nr:response regulator [Polyangiaceae bacterium]
MSSDPEQAPRKPWHPVPGIIPAIPGYDLGQRLYDSARSVVFRATREHDRHPVVLKLLKPDHPTPASLELFQKEFETTRNLDAPGIIRVLGLERYRQTAVLVLEDVGGDSLDHWLARWRTENAEELPVVRFLDLAIKIAEAVSQVHACGVIHRDINPSNLVVDPRQETVKVIDFGLATSRQRGSVAAEAAPELQGTLAYLSPEQTGRTSRAVDHRTDLYSLGVTFYEMLTGRLPFEDTDPLALVHAHLAMMAIPAAELRSSVPTLLSDLAMKLLAKAPHDRYQSAFGVRTDLERCLAHLRLAPGHAPPPEPDFPLGERDDRCLVEIPERLYGRTEPTRRLFDALERTWRGESGVVFVTGEAGVGKSALVAQLREPTNRLGGHFVQGKYDRYAETTPYAGLVRAFDRWTALILAEPKDRVQRWRDVILAALGPNADAVIEVLPGLSRITPETPPAPRLGPQESLNRLTLAFRDFVRAVATAAHPLVLFLDDVQWADDASAELLHLLAADQTIRHFLLVGAYRDSDLAQTIPLRRALARLADDGIRTDTIGLSALGREDVSELVRDSLGCPNQDAQALGELVFAKTQGNAFFARQLIGTIADDGGLSYSFHEHRWTWDAERITSQGSADNVVALVTSRINGLPRKTSRLLPLAACLGSTFFADTLAKVSEMSMSEVLTDLAPGVAEGLLVALDHDQTASAPNEEMQLAFLHDRVRQACYDTLAPDERRLAHLSIARALQQSVSPDTMEPHVFAAVQHYREGRDLLEQDDERTRAADLAMRAADLAGNRAAFQSARDYLEFALTLMPEDAWRTRYEVMLALHSQLATALVPTGGGERLDQICRATEAMARTPLDTARVKVARIKELLTQARPTEAAALGLDFIETLGVTIPRDLSPEEAIGYFRETAEWFTSARIEGLKALPDAPEEVRIIFEVAVVINGSVFECSPFLSFVFVSRITRLCAERGHGLWSPVSLATFALDLCAGLNDIPRARQLTAVTMELYEHRFRSDSLVAPLGVGFGGFVAHRYQHLRTTLPLLAAGIDQGLASGAFEFVVYCAWYHATHLLFLGSPLEQVEADVRRAVETCGRVRMVRQRRWCSLLLQVVRNLRGDTEDPLDLTEAACDEERGLSLARETNDNIDVFRICFYRAWLCFWLKSRAGSASLFGEATSFLTYNVGLYFVPLFHFYDALANAAAHPHTTADDQARISARITHDLDEMRVWVEHAPMNHEHKVELMRAELARIEGRHWDAFCHYQRSIEGAREQGFVPEEALACELCAEFLRTQGQRDLGDAHAARAQRLTATWGAKAKLAALVGEPTAATIAMDDSLEPFADAGAPPHMTRTGSSSAQRAGRALDVVSLLRAQQTLSQTTERSGLCAEMIRLVLENAGAERVLLLHQDEGEWFVVGRGHVRGEAVETNLRVPLAEAPDLSRAIVHFAIRSGAPVVVANAAVEPEFAGETYLRDGRAKSVLSLPVWHQGALRLLVYLENNVTAGAFTEGRLETLRLLSSQMAISMENALVHERLETLVQRRTAELAVAKDRAEAASAAKSAFLTKMSHELRTPLNGILGYAQLLRERARDAGFVDGLNVIQNSGEHLLATINALLDHAKADAGRVELRIAELTLQPFLAGVVSMVHSRAEAKRLTLEWRAPSTLPDAVLADEDGLRRVLLNLLGNAIKFTERGAVRLAVEPQDTEDGADGSRRVTLRFAVTDTGPGLATEEQDRVFLPFEQGSGTGRGSQGTGLGLTISQELVRLMGGGIQVQSELGRGSTFWFDLTVPVVSHVVQPSPDETTGHAEEERPDSARLATPPPQDDLDLLRDLARRGDLVRIMAHARRLENEDPRYSAFARRLHDLAKAFDEGGVLDWLERSDGQAAEEEGPRGDRDRRMTVPPEDALEPAATRPRLLIADDQLDNIALLADMLASNGFETLIARDGASALAKAAYAQPDLVLLDVMMPGIDGLEACRRLKASPDTSDIPVIFLTAVAKAEHVVAGFEAGGVDYIAKPLRVPEVLARIAAHLALRNTQRELAARNEALTREITVRQRAEEALRNAHDSLERRIAERTLELASANLALGAEVTERRRAQADLQRRNRELTLLNRVIGASGNLESREAMLAVICRELAVAFELDGVTAMAVNDALDQATVLASSGKDSDGRGLGRTLRLDESAAVVQTLRHRTPLVVDDAERDTWLTELVEPAETGPIRALLAVPLVTDSATRAVLGLASSTPRRFTDEDVGLAECVAREVGGALARIQATEDRQKLEEQYFQAQKMEAIGRLTGGVAHDFNNVLTVILGQSELVLDSLSPNSLAHEGVAQIRQAAERAAKLTRQLLAFSRRQLLRPELLDLNQVVAGLTGMLRALLGEDVDLRIALCPALGPTQADGGQLTQVIMNLVVNARDAMPQGGQLTLETSNFVGDEANAGDHPGVGPGPYVRLAVTDTGVGMTPETKAHAFEPFFTTKEKGKGTGLGLATVHGIVTQSGGHVRLLSEFDQGTTVEVYLPRATPTEAPKQTVVPMAATVHATERILLVEDEGMVRSLASRVLTGKGYAVMTAANAAEARALSANSNAPIHLLLTDVVMPGGTNGVELAGELERRRPGLRVLFMSGYTENAALREAISEHRVAFLQKPFTPDELARKVREVLDSR